MLEVCQNDLDAIDKEKVTRKEDRDRHFKITELTKAHQR